MSRRPFAGIVLVVSMFLAGCGSDPDGASAVPLTRGVGNIWLASNEPRPTDPKYYEMRPVANIEGMITAVESGPAVPPSVLLTFYAGEGASQVLTIRDSGGIDWKLGYHVGRASPAVDVTPDLTSLIGTRARLLFRAVRGFGTAPGFVLFDDVGVVFAMDLAIYGDPLQTNDVTGLTVQDGIVLATMKHDCVDHLLHTSLIFTADQPVDVRPNAEGTVSIKGTRYAATNLFSVRVDGQARCPDFVGTERGWAIWRRP